MDPATGIGFLISLVAFLRSEIGGRKGKEELLTALSKQDTTQSYLEWLRRQDQQVLIKHIESSKSELLEVARTLREQLGLLAHQIWLQAGDMQALLRDLNDRIRPPVFSSRPLPNRPRADIPMVGRDQELQWLLEGKEDLILSGQPGSGKTELLQAVAENSSARFLLTEDHDQAVAAILANCPPVILVDDAGTSRELLLRIRHLREEYALDFRLVASCWPFDKGGLQQSLRIGNAATKELEPLPRKVIAAIIREIAKSQGKTVNDQFIRVVAEQARGMPGLAASLTLATMEAGGEALVSGELLLKNLAPFLLRTVGPQIIQILGAFACGGKRGISVEVVARLLGKDLVQVVTDMQRVALAGVLEQTEMGSLLVQPDFLRSSLLKETFFPDQGIALSWKLCRSLIQSAEQPALGYLEIILSRGRAQAQISDQQLRDICHQVNDEQLWSALAWLDESNCRWALKMAPTSSEDVKRAALHYCPAQIVPALIGQDARLLENWSRSGWNDAFRRREFIFNAALSVLRQGNVTAAFPSLSLSLELEYHNTDSDPADPNIFHFQRGLIPLPAARDVFTFWQRLLLEYRNLPKFPWGHIVGIFDHWAHAGGRLMVSLPKDYQDFLAATTHEMIDGLNSLAGDNQAAIRWLNLQKKRHNLSLEVPAADADFMALFPEERLDDWEAAEVEHAKDARDLAFRWKDRPFEELANQLVVWHQQSDEFGRVWPQMLPAFSRELAAIRTLNSSELSFALSSLPPRAIGPFLDQAITGRSIIDQQLQLAVNRRDLHGILIEYTLKGKTPELYGQLLAELPHWETLVKSLCMRNEVSIEMLENLLRHEDRHLRREVAFYLLRGKSLVPEGLRKLWRKVVVDALIKLAEGEDEPPYDIHEILLADPTIGLEVLEGIIESSSPCLGLRSGNLLNQIISPLSKEKRRELLHRVPFSRFSPLPRLLVGRDPELFQVMINIPTLKPAYSSILAGDPNGENWSALAKIALAAGFSHQNISHTADAEGFSWTGNLSNYYQQWVERFTKLRENPDPDIQRIAEEGIRWSSLGRDERLSIEKKEAVYGW